MTLRLPPKHFTTLYNPEMRGVFEVEAACNCFRGFVIKNAYGKRLRYVEIPTEDCGEEEIDKLWRWLDRHDPVMRVI